MWALSSGKQMGESINSTCEEPAAKAARNDMAPPRQAWCGQGTLQPDWLCEKWILCFHNFLITLTYEMHENGTKRTCAFVFINPSSRPSLKVGRPSHSTF